jgi:hypothetical protein
VNIEARLAVSLLAAAVFLCSVAPRKTDAAPDYSYVTGRLVSMTDSTVTIAIPNEPLKVVRFAQRQSIEAPSQPGAIFKPGRTIRFALDRHHELITAASTAVSGDGCPRGYWMCIDGTRRALCIDSGTRPAMKTAPTVCAEHGMQPA